MCRVILLASATLCLCLASCTDGDPQPSIAGQDIQLTLLHTTDIHSRLVPYDLKVGEIDLRLGLAQELEPFGGAARMAYVLDRERGRAGRVLHVDTGDSFQGAPIFNFFLGETEMRFLDMVHLDVMVMGNHEFDMGGTNLYNQIDSWAMFPVLAANYRWEDPELPYNSHLGRVSHPYTIMNLQGLRVGLIGLANLSSLNSIFDTGNRLGITPLDAHMICQYYVDFLKPQVDLIIVLSHMGLTADVELIEAVSGMDVVFGGHHHVVLNPPRIIEDPEGRQVLNPHSGAFAKYIGRFDIVVRECHRIAECRARYAEQGVMAEDIPDNDWEVVSTRYQAIPIDSSLAEEPRVAEMMDQYERDMAREVDLNQIVGYAPKTVRRFSPTGGDSQLGNLVATSMRVRRGVGADFALTNTLGIRADFVPGPVSLEQMFNVFPFENTITTLNLSGSEVQELFDFVADRSAGRGSSTQAQIAGAAVVMDSGTRTVRRVLINDASPIPGAGLPEACIELQEAYDRCESRDGTDGSIDEDHLESTCEDEARDAISGCPEEYEPYYRTDPCGPEEGGGEADAECISRSDNQRCFIQSGRRLGRCYFAVVDDYELIDPYGAYQLAANDYIARGGSGFRVLGRNTSSNNLGIPLRDVLVDYIRAGDPCTDNQPCTHKSDCLNDEMCACDAVVPFWDDFENDEALCAGDSGRCILTDCAIDVAEFQAERVMTCHVAEGSAQQTCIENVRRWALPMCQELACIDEDLGAVADGRIVVVQP